MLINGGYALVSDEDYEYLSQWKWAKDPTGYARRTNLLPKTLSRNMHRLLINPPAGLVVDHINGNRLDNRRENLRLCTQSQNLGNSGINSTNKSGIKGVCYCSQTGKWKAYLSLDGKQHWLGRFGNIEDAARARAIAASEKYGEFDYGAKIEAKPVEITNRLSSSEITFQMQSRRYPRIANKYLGVVWNQRRRNWNVYVRKGGKSIYITSSSDAEECAYIYDQIALQLNGPYARINTPMENWGQPALESQGVP